MAIKKKVAEPEHAPAGHNSYGVDDNARQQLRNFNDRLDNLEAEKKEIAEQIREVYAEMKVFGFDTKIMRAARRELARDAAEREETEALKEIYMMALEERV
jgi:uncharacterized protein (UPF0335 family)